MRGKIIVAALLILVLGALIRFTNLESIPVFADESIYIRWAQVMAAESTLRFLPLSDGKQPLFMWLLMPVLKVVNDPLIAGRLLSGIFDLGSIVSLGFLAYFLFKKISAGLLAGLLWATAPYAVFFGRMALVDSALTFFIITGFLFAFLAISRLRWDFALVSGLVFGLAWLTKSPAMFILLLLPILSLFILKPINRSSILKLLFLFSTIYFLSSTMYQILRLGPEFHMIAIRNRDYVWPISEVLKHPFDPLLPHLRDSFLFFLLYLNPIILFTAIYNLKNIFNKKLSVICFLFSVFWLAPILSQAFIAKTLTARYLLYTVPFAILLASKANYKLLLTGIFLNLLLSFQLINFPIQFKMPRIERAGYLEEWTAGFGIKEVSQYLEKIDEPVVVGSEGYFGTPFSALEMYLNHKKNIRITGLSTYTYSVDNKLKTATKENQVFMVFNLSRLRFNGSIYDFAEKNNLKVLGYYPKTQPPQEKLKALREPADALIFFQVL